MRVISCNILCSSD